MQDKELTEIANIQDPTDRNEKFKFYPIKAKAVNIANNRFIENVKYIYTNCTPKSLNNGEFEELCEILGFCEKDAIDRDINSLALSEIIKHKNNLSTLILTVIDRILDFNESIDESNYNFLCLKMLSIVCTKQECLQIYSCMISKLDFGRIKAIQELLDQ